MPRLIAIGDVHGHLLALNGLLDLIQPVAGDEFVFLGDLIDRGPDSAGVLDRVIALAQEFPVTCILGNHEEMVLAAATGKSDLKFWMHHGGKQALQSWGLDAYTTDPQIIYKIPGKHLQLIHDMVNYHEVSDHIFVHAAYHPNRAMHQQSGTDLRWVLLPMDLGPHYSKKTVWCGHSRQDQVADVGHLVCIDLGCGVGGVRLLTGVDVHTRTYYQVTEQGKPVP